MYVHINQILCCPLAQFLDLRLIHRLLQARHSTTASSLEFCYFAFTLHIQRSWTLKNLSVDSG